MDRNKLQIKLTKAKIIFGDVGKTIHTFTKKYNPAVIGCVFHDLDFYSSTKAALKLFTEDESNFLPRSLHYFDDIIGSEVELYNNWTGERLAISEFNDENESRKFDLCYHLVTQEFTKVWYHQIRVLHLFNHPQYCNFIGTIDH